MKICDNLKMITIAIGPHSAADVDEVLNILGCNYLINGEPEVALSRFLNSFMQDKTVEGLCCREYKNGIAKEVMMRNLSIPDYDSVDILNYEIHAWSDTTINELTEKGIKGTMIDLMQEAGCVYIEYGVESFSEEVLKAINKSLDKQKLLRIIAYSYEKFGKNNIELEMINFYTEDIINIFGFKREGKWNSKVLRPYPDTLIGDKIYEIYNVTENKWEFLVRYIWWLQIENYENYFNIQHDLKIKDLILFGDYEDAKNCSYEMITEYRKMSAIGLD